MGAVIPDTASSQDIFKYEATLRAARSALNSLQVNAAPRSLPYPFAPDPAGHRQAAMSQPVVRRSRSKGDTEALHGSA